MTLRIAAPKTGTASVIFLHGLGDSGNGWSFLAGECHRRPSLQHLNFVFPDAPLRQYPAFGGRAPGWFEMSGMGRSMDGLVNDFDGLRVTMDYIHSLVQSEIEKGVSPNQIIVGGFSQGAASTLSFATTYTHHKLAGFVSLSGFIPHKKELAAVKSELNADRPVFLGHGTADPVVPYQESVSAKDVLASRFGFTNVSLHTYKGLPHSLDPQELEDILKFFGTVVPEK